MKEAAYAKINLALHVRSRETDGYHRLETLFAFAEHGDLLSVAPADALTLETVGPFAPALGHPAENLVLRAAEALRACGRVRTGAALTLDKRLPVAAGIGGGSADAAAALRLLVRWWRIDVPEPELLALAASLGADVPACLRSETVRGEGRGDRLVAADGADLRGAPVLLVNAGVPLSTAAVFAGWDGADRGGLADWRSGRNDLETPARRLAPAVGEVLDALSPLAAVARMSGSGATCFGLFQTAAERDAAAASLAARYPHWWQLATRLR